MSTLVSGSKRTGDEALRYSHHIYLMDSQGRGIGINAVNIRGEPDITAIRRTPYPMNTLEVSSGSGQWSKRRLPFGQTGKSDWSGGMGLMDGEKDATKFYFSSGIWSASPNGLMVGPRQAWCRGYGDEKNQSMPHLLEDWSVASNHVHLSAAGEKTATKFVLTSNQTVIGATILTESLMATGTIKVGIWSHDAINDRPNTALLEASSTMHLPICQERTFAVATSSAVTLSAGTYWIVVTVDNLAFSNDGSFTLGTTTSSGLSSKFYNGSTWAAQTPAICFALASDRRIKDAKFFRYKWGLYHWITNEDGTVRLYLNGDRGLAADNAGDKTKLNVTSKSASAWVANQWVGSVVRIYGGPGSGEWRVVTSNTTSVITVDRAWTTTHTASSQFVIVGSVHWYEISGHGLSWVEDVCVSKEGIVYFAQGDTRAIRKMKEENSSGAWTRSFADDATDGASRLMATVDQLKQDVIWRARNGEYGDVSKAVAAGWSATLTFEAGIKLAGLEQDINGFVEADQKIYVCKMDAIWAISAEGTPARVIGWPLIWNRASGKNPEVSSPYIVFPVRNGLVRLHGNSTIMEDFGPDKDDGLPASFGGYVADIKQVEGRGGLLLAINAGAATDESAARVGESGIYVYRNGSWHGLCHFGWGSGVYAMGWQDTDEGKYFLYARVRDGIRMLQFPGEWDLRKDLTWMDDERRADGGYILLGRMNAGSNMNVKYWDRVTVMGKGLGLTTAVYYRTSDPTGSATEADISLWTYAGRVYDDLEGVIRLGIESRELWLMVVIKRTGVVKALQVDYLARMEDADSWTVPFRISDMGFDRNGRREEWTAEQTIRLLDEWARSPTPLTMYSMSPVMNSRRVVIQRPGIQIAQFSPEPTATLHVVQGREIDRASMTLLGIDDEIEV